MFELEKWQSYIEIVHGMNFPISNLNSFILLPQFFQCGLKLCVALYHLSIVLICMQKMLPRY